MKVVTLDFETYYSKDYSLSKITTEEYVRDPRFQIIGVGVKVDDAHTEWFSGTHRAIKDYLEKFDLPNNAVLAHNMLFDGAILSWRLGIKPKVYFDTLCMARAVHGVEKSASLKALAENYGVGEKGTEVLNALGKRRADFTAEELSAYGHYCVNDVDLTYDIFTRMLASGFPKKELKLIDLTLRMFTDPLLELDRPHLEQHLDTTVKMKEQLLVDAGVTDKADLMSNPKFALMLNMLDVTPPVKISPTTGKETFAFAKNDEDFKALAEHEDVRVQTLVAARLGNKSTLEETRTQRFIDIADRGKLPVPVRYYAAHTGRWGGDDKINLQNLPSRGPNAKQLKKAIIAPDGYSIVEADSAQIEARVLAWLAEQNEVVEAFAQGKDVYKKMATAIYGVSEEAVTKEQRFVGKTTVLGCLAEGTLVLTDRGWVSIEDVSPTDQLWDGEGWVCHQGLVKKGTKETLNVSGLWLTPDHKVLCGTEWLDAQLVAQDENILSRALDTGAVGWEQDYSTDFLLLSRGATSKQTAHMPLTAVEAYKCTESGETTEQNSCSTHKPYPDGTTPRLNWIERTTIAVTSPETYDLSPAQLTALTAEQFVSCKRNLMTYDIAYAGPRNRYTVATAAGPLIVHNCGYGMGGDKFQAALKAQGVDLPVDETKRIIGVYRQTNDAISDLWKQCGSMLRYLVRGDALAFGRPGVLQAVPDAPGILLPSGLILRYDDLQETANEKGGVEYSYQTRQGRTRIYGGKVVENVCQAIARCIIGEQMLQIAKRYKVVLTVHDSILCCVPDNEAPAAKEYVEQRMRWVPDWAEGLPVNCEAGIGKNYGECS